MKILKKYTKWSLALCMALTAPLFSSCNDDDEVINVVPDDFKLEITSLNISWDETEGYVVFDANADWKVESTSPWISVDPTKGDPGVGKTYFIFEPNPYRLPRKGEVTVTCGDQQGVVTITQGGCTDEAAIAPASGSLEIPSFDYETGEIPFSTYSEYIMGNMGLTIAEFGAGVDDDGDLQFFMVGKDGSWYAGGTSGTRCGAWLDSDYNVVPWDGAGYPAIATFIEIYGGDDPMLVIGRAPGVPDNAEYTLNFGIATSDLTKYQLFTINVVFPAADLKGTVVGTIDLSFQKDATEDYASEPCTFDLNEVTSMLGCASIQSVKVVGYDAAGEFIPYTANNGYWYDTHGNISSWGDGAGWFIEYYGNDSDEPEDLTSFWIGNFPGVENASGTSKIGFWYNGNVVMFNVHVVIGEGGGDEPGGDEPGGDEPGTDEGAVKVLATNALSVTHTANTDYIPSFFEFDANEVVALLGCFSMEDVEVISLDSDGQLVGQTGNNGFWYNYDGGVTSWGNDSAWFIEYHGIDEEDVPVNQLSVGNFPDVTSANGTCSFGFAYDGKAVMYNITVTVVE